MFGSTANTSEMPAPQDPPRLSNYSGEKTRDEESSLGTMEPAPQRSWLARMGPSIACGAGLFSDGYVNCVIGAVSTVLERKYENSYTDNPLIDAVRSVALVGTLIGQLSFGYLADKWSRRHSLTLTTVMLIVFTALCAAAYWPGSINNTLTLLVVWRFFVGIGIGGEYPAGSVACAESQGEVAEGTRNRWFIMFTNAMIDLGFVLGSIVPTVTAYFAPDNYDLIWRFSMGFGCVFPTILLFFRRKLEEPEEFKKNSMKDVSIPYRHATTLYAGRLIAVASIWFIYDVSSYSFSIYSSRMLSLIHGDDAPLWRVFAWTIVIHLFYMPGAIGGAFLSDKFGPRTMLSVGTMMQGIMALCLAAAIKFLMRPDMIPLFVIMYGLFMALGEMGPGDNIGLVASKTSATGIRGQYYGIVAAIGKLGAFAGVYIFKYVQAAADGDEIKELQFPFWVAGALCFMSSLIARFALPVIGQASVESEDEKFRDYLESKGWDTSKMGC